MEAGKKVLSRSLRNNKNKGLMNSIILGKRSVLNEEQAYLVVFGQLITDANEAEEIANQILKHAKVLKLQNGKSSSMAPDTSV